MHVALRSGVGGFRRNIIKVSRVRGSFSVFMLNNFQMCFVLLHM